MKEYKYYIGVDVSKKTLDVCALKDKVKIFHLRINNDQAGLKKLSKKKHL